MFDSLASPTGSVMAATPTSSAGSSNGGPPSWSSSTPTIDSNGNFVVRARRGADEPEVADEQAERAEQQRLAGFLFLMRWGRAEEELAVRRCDPPPSS